MLVRQLSLSSPSHPTNNISPPFPHSPLTPTAARPARPRVPPTHATQQATNDVRAPQRRRRQQQQQHLQLRQTPRTAAVQHPHLHHLWPAAPAQQSLGVAVRRVAQVVTPRTSRRRRMRPPSLAGQGPYTRSSRAPVCPSRARWSARTRAC